MRKIDSKELRMVEAGGFVNNDNVIGYTGTILSFIYDKKDPSLTFSLAAIPFGYIYFQFDFEDSVYGYSTEGLTLIGLIKAILN